MVEGATSIEVTFADGTTSAAQVVASTPDRDTAVLRPDQPPSVVVPAVLGGGVKVGDDTFSVGNPLGLADSMTAGVVSGLDRSIEREDGGGELSGLIQFDAAVNPGSSGGPLLNRQGQVVGIVTALANPSGQRFFVGIGFAVPIGGGGGGGPHPTELTARPAGTTRGSRAHGTHVRTTVEPDGAGALRDQEGHRRAGRAARAAGDRAARPRATSSSRACPVWRRRWRSRRSPMRSAASSSASSSRPTSCPADLVGTRIYNQRSGEFTTSLGPVFTNLLLADEINRAPAKVQSALLEVMQERQVTIGRETHSGARPVPRDGDAEPDRVRRHLPAAGGAGRPLHAEGAGVVPLGHRGVRDRRAHDRPGWRRCDAGAQPPTSCSRSSGRATRSTSTRR